MRPVIIPPNIVTTMTFLMIRVLKCLQVMEDVDKGLLIPVTLPLSIADSIIVVMMVEVDLGFKRPSTLPLAIVEFFISVFIVEVELGLKRPDTLPIIIVDQELMLTGEADIGIRPATLPPIIQVDMVYC